MANVKISDISTTETALSNVAYVEGERGDNTPVKIPVAMLGPGWTDLTFSADGSSKWAGTSNKSQAFTAADGDVFEIEIGWLRGSGTDEYIYVSGDATKAVRLATQSDNNVVSYTHSSTGDASGTALSGGSNIVSGFNGTQRWAIEFNASSAGGQYWMLFWNRKLDKSGRADNGTVPIVGSDLRVYLSSGIPTADIKYARIRKKN
jgi:hypothetical protein